MMKWRFVLISQHLWNQMWIVSCAGTDEASETNQPHK